MTGFSINQSIIYLYQTNGPYQKNGNKSNKSKSNKNNSTQYSLENSVAKKTHTQKACRYIHLKS